MATVYMQIRCALLPSLPMPALSHPHFCWQGKMRKGVKLYRCVWEDFPPDVVWYEIEANVNGTIAYEQYMEQLANDESEAAAAAQEEAELEELEDEEDLPPP